MDTNSLFASYIRQQKELSLPDIILQTGSSAAFVVNRLRPAPASRAAASPRQERAPAAPLPKKSTSSAPSIARSPASGGPKTLSRLKKLSEVPPRDGTATAKRSHEEKRALLAALFKQECAACPLAQTRKKFVFGAGNVSAPLMIVGDAPGNEEDLQGMPFVGPAGLLLNELFAAIAFDRKKDVFITDVLKCRPPDGRTPAGAEVAACLPLLQKQIEIVTPRLLLLLGKTAAHAILEKSDGVGALRNAVHAYRGIPVMVTYHPAAVLRKAEYRKPIEDDFLAAARFIKENTDNGASR
jgi:uracil-DNA glycosylase family 4